MVRLCSPSKGWLLALRGVEGLVVGKGDKREEGEGISSWLGLSLRPTLMPIKSAARTAKIDRKISAFGCIDELINYY